MPRPIAWTRRWLLGALGGLGLTAAQAQEDEPEVEALAHDPNLLSVEPTIEQELEALARRHFSSRRQRNAFLLRAVAARPLAPIRDRTVSTAGYKASYSKILQRAPITSSDVGLPLKASFDELRSVLADLYNGSQPGHALDKIEALVDLIGDKTPNTHLRFTDPLGGLSYDLEGLDPASGFMRPSPPAAGRTTAAEMAELYWMAMNRDTPFSSLTGDGTAAPAALAPAIDSLSKDYAYFRDLGGFTKQRLFRPDLRDRHHPGRWGFPGIEQGPYVSQFLFRGSTRVNQDQELFELGGVRFPLKQHTVNPNHDYLLDPDDTSTLGWQAVQNGSSAPAGSDDTDGTPRYIRSLRDGGNYAHFDKIYQEYLIAAISIINGLPGLGAFAAKPPPPPLASIAELSAGQAGRNETLNYGNPYYDSKAQVGFATFGLTHIVALLAEVTTRAHRAAWYQKWRQLRMRPEEFGGCIHFAKTKGLNREVHQEMLGDNKLLKAVADFSAQNAGGSALKGPSYLLPQLFPEGCPTHPAYPSGHATVAGACAVILKAMFNETARLTSDASPALIPDEAGEKLVAAPGPKILTVGGEINKLAANVSMFRSMAGVHWRSDAVQGMLLGEQVGMALLMQQSQALQLNGATLSTYWERSGTPGRRAPFFRFTLLSGRAVEVRDGNLYAFDDTPFLVDGVTYKAPQDWGQPKRTQFGEFVDELQGNPRYE